MEARSQTVLFGGRSVSGHDIRHQAACAASGLAALGVGHNDTVAVLMRNEPVWLSVLLAAQKLGAYYVGINWHFKADEVAFIVADSEAKVLVVHSDLLPDVSANLPQSLKVLVVATPPEVIDAYGLSPSASSIASGLMDWHEWIQGYAPWPHPDLPPLGNIYYTSGTTGRPKGVRRLPGTAEQSAAWHRTRALATNAWDGFRTVIVGPLYHGGPNTAAVVALNLASLIVMMPRFDALELLEHVSRHRLTHVPLVPIMLVRMMALPPEMRARFDMSSIEIVTHGGSACPPEIKRRAIEWLGPKLVETYGSSEVGLVTMLTSTEWLSRPGSVGRPFAGTRIRIVDDEGAELPTGIDGEIWVDPGPNSLPFTYQNNEAARRAVERDGFISVGDIGHLDADGYLYITDRKRDMIVSGGVNIYPAEIEKVLVLCPGVRDCAVFSAPDTEYGERVVAAVQRESGAMLGESEVRQFLRDRIAAYKVPRTVEFHEALPRDSMGKIFKNKLREPHWRGTGRKI